MKTLLIALSFFSAPTHAAMNLKPGLWEIKSKIKNAQGEVDPMARMKESLAKMPAAQRKQIEDMMAKQGAGISGSSGIKACYTAEMLKDPESIAHSAHKGNDCTTKITEQTSTKMTLNFECKNGSKGTGQWNFHGNEKYDGVMKLTSAQGEASEISHSAKFLSTDCGAVKPITLPKK